MYQSRLGKILRHKDYRSYKEYLDFVASDETGNALVEMLDALTTNLTFFFRENRHFDYITKVMTSQFNERALQQQKSSANFWSAGCSTGEEPYSIAMTLLEAHQTSPWNIKILATDLSTKVLEKAQKRIYDPEELKKMSLDLQRKYFDKIVEDGEELVRVHDEIQKLITFRRFNLMQPFPSQEAFDCIFCRNVMIYFDHDTQERLIEKFYNALQPGGHLFIGHSETLSRMEHKFEYVQPTIYRRPIGS